MSGKLSAARIRLTATLRSQASLRLTRSDSLAWQRLQQKALRDGILSERRDMPHSRFYAPFGHLIESLKPLFYMAPRVGLEPTTNGLTVLAYPIHPTALIYHVSA